jgi:threonine/homoserine/homoserine lactone efflux protein
VGPACSILDDLDQRFWRLIVQGAITNLDLRTMSLMAFIAGVFTLLVLPGPTNAVLAMASAALTPMRAVLLVSTVISSYLVVVIPVVVFAGPLLNAHPTLSQVIKLMSATWVLYLGSRLWVREATRAVSIIGWGQLSVTTMLNPKAIMVGLTFMPSLSCGPRVAILAFVCIAAATSVVWLGLGSLILAGQPQIPLRARRCGTVVLLTFSVGLTLSAISQMTL